MDICANLYTVLYWMIPPKFILVRGQISHVSVFVVNSLCLEIFEWEGKTFVWCFMSCFWSVIYCWKYFTCVLFRSEYCVNFVDFSECALRDMVFVFCFILCFVFFNVVMYCVISVEGRTYLFWYLTFIFVFSSKILHFSTPWNPVPSLKPPTI